MELLARLGIEVWGSGPDEMDAVVTAERGHWGAVIRAAGIASD